jgi:GTP-binding protein
MMRNYMLKREQLQYVCLLVDSRIPPQKIDLEFIQWMGEKRIAFLIIFTKADRPGAKETVTNIQLFKEALLKEWSELPPMFTTSSEKRIGKELVWGFIKAAVEDYAKNQPQRIN